MREDEEGYLKVIQGNSVIVAHIADRTVFFLYWENILFLI